MPRYKKYDYAQSILLPIEFKKRILSGTIEYVIDYMVEKKLNLKALEARYKNDETGAPAYDTKILLLTYTRGIISSRKIRMLCGESILFKALSADSNPEFTTIAWFVRSMEKNIRGLFCDVLLVCMKMDLIGKI